VGTRPSLLPEVVSVGASRGGSDDSLAASHQPAALLKGLISLLVPFNGLVIDYLQLYAINR